MRRWGVAGSLILCLALVGTACTLGKPKEPTIQQVKVSRGDIVVSASGSGNIETPNDVKLTFASSGRIDKIFVKEGEQVSQGKILAKLETDALGLARTQAQVSLNQAKLILTQAQFTQQSAEYELSRTEDKKPALELALLNSQINLKTAQYNLDKAKDTYRWPEVEASQSDVDKTKSYVEYVTTNLSQATSAAAIDTWTNALIRAQASLDAAEAKLKAQLKGYDTEEVAIKKMQVDAAQMALNQAQRDIDQLADELTIKKSQVDSSKESVEQAKQSIQLAQQSLDQAQKQLDESTITAPFDGVVALVGVKEGDIVPSSSLSAKTIVQLVDTTKLELVVDLDEIDMPGVKLNQEAVITVDALPGETFKGKVASIYPVPNTVSGVVLYNVKLNLDVPQGSKLRLGMSASADIVLNKSSNVLIAPARAISEDNKGEFWVKILINEQVQDRQIITGLSDGVNTEIVSGLSEGDILIIQTSPKAESQPSGLF